MRSSALGMSERHVHARAALSFCAGHASTPEHKEQSAPAQPEPSGQTQSAQLTAFVVSLANSVPPWWHTGCCSLTALEHSASARPHSVSEGGRAACGLARPRRDRLGFLGHVRTLIIERLVNATSRC